jgi:hypothetical protein
MCQLKQIDRKRFVTARLAESKPFTQNGSEVGADPFRTFVCFVVDVCALAGYQSGAFCCGGGKMHGLSLLDFDAKN